jgi:hypothetical protein
MFSKIQSDNAILLEERMQPSYAGIDVHDQNSEWQFFFFFQTVHVIISSLSTSSCKKQFLLDDSLNSKNLGSQQV